ncbi:MAG: exosortase/archaeosortase family protein [Verrucomicrobia bacterium]|nr:exosortase/archaeosortase family protein [Verrucomicrobiota bacterium]
MSTANATAPPAELPDTAGASPAPPISWPVVACFAVLWGSLSLYLGAEWSLSEQYSYGWFVPFLAAALFWLRWEQCPPAAAPAPATGRDGMLAAGAVVILLLIPLFRLMEVANPEWRHLAWAHSLCACALTLGLIWRCGGRPWLAHLSFPVCFFFVAVPWLRGFEDYIIQTLMRGVASLSVEVVALFGIPAQAEGNLIRIGRGVVGVNEACSGVRSLQTSIMIGLLLGELNRFSVPRRIAMLAGAVGTALFANAFRATYLVWIAAGRGLEEVERQHDFIGYFILGTVFGGSLLLAAILKRTELPKRPQRPAPPAPARAWSAPTALWVGIAAWLLAAEGAVEGWYRWHERGLPSGAPWEVNWPAKSPGFKDVPIPELTARILRYDEGRSVSWQATPNPREGGYLMFAFRWNPGRNSTQLATDHHPEVCMPASGLKQMADHGRKSYPIPGGSRTIEFQQLEFARPTHPNQRLHVFFSLTEDVPRTNLDFNVYTPGNLAEQFGRRLRLALAGRRNLGQQMIQIMMFDAGNAEEAAAAFPDLLRQLLRARPQRPT